MIEPLQVRPEEGKGLRLFQLDVNEAELKRLQAVLKASEPGLASGLLADLLGVEAVDASRIEIFDLRDLTGFGLLNYLVKANGLPESALIPGRARIEALEGVVLILYARAFGDQDVTLAPAPPLTLIGAWDEEPPEIQFTPLRSDSAKGQLPPQDPIHVADGRSPRWLWLVGLLAAAAIVALIVGLQGSSS